MTPTTIPHPLAEAVATLREAAEWLEKRPDFTEGDAATACSCRKSLAALEAFAEKEETRLKAWSDAEDKPLPEDALIEDALPYNDGDHKRYSEALRLVGAKYSKSSLVALVNWLLSRVAEKDEGMPHYEGKKYQPGDIVCFRIDEAEALALSGGHSIRCRISQIPKRDGGK